MHLHAKTGPGAFAPVVKEVHGWAAAARDLLVLDGGTPGARTCNLIKDIRLVQAHAHVSTRHVPRSEHEIRVFDQFSLGACKLSETIFFTPQIWVNCSHVTGGRAPYAQTQLSWRT